MARPSPTRPARFEQSTRSHATTTPTDPAGGTLLDESDETYLAGRRHDRKTSRSWLPASARASATKSKPPTPRSTTTSPCGSATTRPCPSCVLLGPVRATTRGKPLTKRKPYMTELLAFIALRRLGATTDEVADTFNITKAKARDYVVTIRQWLGTNPRTGPPPARRP
jgi:hypothetical protein